MIRAIVAFSLFGLAGCNQAQQSSDGFFLDCEGATTYEARTGTLTEPYRNIFFVSEEEKEVREGDEFGVPLCGSAEGVRMTRFEEDEISCRRQFDDGVGMSYGQITINRVSGHLSIVEQQFVGDEASGVITTQATCSRSHSRPENKL